MRFYKLQGDVLTITGAPAKDPHTGQDVVHRICSENIKPLSKS